MDRIEGFLHVARIESDERVLPHLGAMNGFRPDFVNRPFRALLGE
jgi:hypothetical protein